MVPGVKMQNVIKPLIGRLLADAVVSSIVGNKVYYAMAPQGTDAPVIVLTRVVGMRTGNISEPPTGLASARVQVDMYHKSAQGARALARAVRESLNLFRGEQSGVVVHSVLLVDEMDQDSDLPELQGVIQDYRVWFRE